MALAIGHAMTTHDPPTARRFVVVTGLDASPAAESVLSMALQQLRGKPRPHLALVHVLDLATVPTGSPVLDAGRDLLDRYRDRTETSCDARVTSHLGVGRPWTGIVQVAVDLQADLIVVGTHGRRGLERMVLGSQAEMVVRHASCPVLVVRPDGYQAPVEGVPEIEPPCPDCVHVQNESNGAVLWCARHTSSHPRHHLHYEFPQGSFGRGSSLIQPD